MDDEDDKGLAKRLGLGIKALLALGSAVGGGSDDGDDKSGGPGNDDKGKEASMKKKELIALLLKTEKVSFSEEELGKMKDEQLKSLATLAGCDCGDDDEAEAKKKADAAAKEKADAEAKEKADAEAKKKAEAEGDDDKKKGDDQVTLSAKEAKFVKSLSALSEGSVDGLAALIEAGEAEGQRRAELQKNLVAQLAKDDKVAMGEAVLKGMSLEALEGLDRSLNPLNYAGRGGPRIENTGDDDVFAPDPLPVVLAELSDDEKKGGD